MDKCFVCNVKFDASITDEKPNWPGLIFTSTGNWGSTIFDPMDGSCITIMICDRCVVFRLGLTEQQGPTKPNTELRDDVQNFYHRQQTIWAKLCNITTRESIAAVEISRAMLMPESKLINQETLTLLIPNGSQYTLIPISQHYIIKALLALREMHEYKPESTISSVIEHLEALRHKVKMLCGTVEFYKITSKEQLQQLICPTTAFSEPPIVKYNIIDDIIRIVTEKYESDR